MIFSLIGGNLVGYIYKIINKINNKVYIGQTTRTIDIRWKQHLNNINHVDTHLYRAMKNYGPENFSIEKIEETENLDEREIYWIQYYDSFNNGYNMTLGGKGFGRQIDYNKIITLWNNGMSINDISKKTGYANQHISNALRTMNIDEASIKKQGLQVTIKKRSIPVYQFDLTGKFIQRYDSVTIAGEINNISKIHINECCKKIAISAGGYLWSYSDHIDEDIILKKQNIKQGGNLKKRAVNQYDKQGNYLNTFISIADAAKSVGGSPANITNVCKGKTKTAYGYKWSYVSQ